MIDKNNQQAIGGLLKNKRFSIGLTIREAAERLKIPLKYIRRIEEERWSELPSRVYVKGFIASYCQLLGLPANKIIDDYNALNLSLFKSNLSDFNSRVSISKDGLIQQIDWVKLVWAGLFITFVAFLIFEARFFYLAPHVFADLENNAVVENNSVILKGAIRYAEQLTVNGERVYSDKNGNFEKEIFLNDGINIVKITAVNKFGRETDLVKRIIKKDPAGGAG